MNRQEMCYRCDFKYLKENSNTYSNIYSNLLDNSVKESIVIILYSIMSFD